MGGVKNPFGGGNIGTGDQIKKYAPIAAIGMGAGGPVAAGLATGAAATGGLDTSIKDPAGMNQYTDLANQAQQEYGNQRAFMGENVNPKRKQMLDQLAAQAAGTGPSIAEAQLKGAFDKSLQQQLAMARSGRTGNAGLASRNLANVASQQQQNLGQQSAIARMQEQVNGQNALQGAIQNEQQYATGTLGSALGSQANVAQMQNAQRDRNDKRNGDIFSGAANLVGSFFGMAEGGKVPSLDTVLANKYGKKPQKLAYGGQYQADVGNSGTAKFVNDTEKVIAAGKDGKQGSPMSMLSGVAKKAGSKKSEADDDTALDAMVSDFEQEEQLMQQKQAVTSFVPRMTGPGAPMLPSSMLPISRVPAYAHGGNVPGNAQQAGDSFANDKVPALLSPGEIVVPRSVVQQGHVASAYFVKKAGEDESYNAKTFAAEKPSLASMLKSINDSEETYKKVSSLIKKGR